MAPRKPRTAPFTRTVNAVVSRIGMTGQFAMACCPSGGAGRAQDLVRSYGADAGRGDPPVASLQSPRYSRRPPLMPRFIKLALPALVLIALAAGGQAYLARRWAQGAGGVGPVPAAAAMVRPATAPSSRIDTESVTVDDGRCGRQAPVDQGRNGIAHPRRG